MTNEFWTGSYPYGAPSLCPHSRATYQPWEYVCGFMCSYILHRSRKLKWITIHSIILIGLLYLPPRQKKKNEKYHLNCPKQSCVFRLCVCEYNEFHLFIACPLFISSKWWSYLNVGKQIQDINNLFFLFEIFRLQHLHPFCFIYKFLWFLA